MSTDKHPTLYVPEGDGIPIDGLTGPSRSYAAFVDPKATQWPTIEYVPASEIDALLADNDRLRATLEGATVLGAVSARHCGKPAPGEMPCRRTPGHRDLCMGLFGEAMAADLADARAEVERLRREASHVAYLRDHATQGCAVCAAELAGGPVTTTAHGITPAEPAVPVSVLADLHTEVEALRRERDAFKEASGLEVNGDPDGVKPEHVEREIAALTARAEKAEKELAAAGKASRIALNLLDDEPTSTIDRLTTERDAAVAHAAALEAALRPMLSAWDGNEHVPFYGNGTAAQGLRDALSGGTSALVAHDAALRAGIVKEVESHAEDVDSMHWRQAHQTIARRIAAIGKK